MNDSIHTVTIAYPNSAHNRTETFDDQADAFRFFDELFTEKADKEYIAIWVCEIDASPNQVHMRRSWKKFS